MGISHSLKVIRREGEESMTEDVQIIMNTIEKLADKLGIAVADVARIFMEAQAKIGMVNLIAASLIIGTALMVWVIITYISYKDLQKIDDAIFMGALIAVCWTVMWGIISLFVMPSVYMVVAPEYMGLKDMVQSLRVII